MVSQECSVYYPFEEPIEPTQGPETDLLASILSGVPQETIHSISQFCMEPRTMVEIEEKYPGVEAWRLRYLGFLEDVGKKGRRIISKWRGYQRDDLEEIIQGQYEKSKAR